MNIGKFPEQIKDSHKIVGCFSYTKDGTAFCDGDACIIAESETIMTKYLKQLSSNKKDLIKKTSFGEILSGLRRGGDYAFGCGAYSKFLQLAKTNGIDWLPELNHADEAMKDNMHFILIKGLY